MAGRATKLPTRGVVEYIMDLVEQNRPRQWIARRVGLSLDEVNAVLKVAGLEGHLLPKPLEEYDLVEAAVEDQWSISEIQRTYGWTHTAVKRWFPNAGWGAGGSSRAAAYAISRDRLDAAEQELYA